MHLWQMADAEFLRGRLIAEVHVVAETRDLACEKALEGTMDYIREYIVDIGYYSAYGVHILGNEDPDMIWKLGQIENLAWEEIKRGLYQVPSGFSAVSYG